MPRLRAIHDLDPNERVLLVARRHALVLLSSALPSVALIVLLCTLAATATAVVAAPLLPVVGMAAIAVSGWLVWLWADWRSDVLVLTDRRVLWIERTPFLRERRWDAPLGSVQNVAALSRGPLSRFLGCADLVLDTASRGAERLHGMRRAHEVAGAIVEAQGYASRRSTRLRRLRTDLGVYSKDVPVVNDPLEVRVWRRHPWVLVRCSIRPLGLLVLGLLVAAGLQVPWAGIIAGGVAILWEAWVVADWRNDELVSTGDRVVQTRRAPLMLEEEMWQVPLGKVQDISYTIPNPLANLLDYGTVCIRTAGDSQDFELSGMPGPRQISAELNRRLHLHRQYKARALISEVELTVHHVLHAYGLSPDAAPRD